jgi:selenocysteine-specific elongation factor
VIPPRLRGTGAAAAAGRELASWPDPPQAADLLRRHLLIRSAAASAMGLRDLPAPVGRDWLADPAYWRQLRHRLVVTVAAHARRDPLALGLSVDAARAELGLPDRGLVEALAAWQEVADLDENVQVDGGYLQPGRAPGGAPPHGTGAAGASRSPQAGATAPQAGLGPVQAGPGHAGGTHDAAAGLPAPVAAAVQALLADLADAPFSAPDSGRLHELGLDARATAAAERAGLLRRLAGNVVLPADAATRAARILAGLPQPFTASEARQALRSSRRVVIPLLEWLDREGVTRRLADDRRVMRNRADAPLSNGEK